MNAEQILEQCRSDWGERDVYYVTPQELRVLVKAEAAIIVRNKNNGDGTFTNEAVYHRRRFMSSSIEPL